MAKVKTIKKIPPTFTKGTGKKKEVYTHFITQKTLKAINETKAQVKDQFKKVYVETNILQGEEPCKVYSLYIIKND